MGNCSSGKKVNVESKRQKLNELDENEIADALDVQYQQSPDIFKLDGIGYDDLFEWLSIKDLDSLGQTCKQMHRITGLHFHKNFKKSELICENKKIYISPREELCGLIPYVRSMTFSYTFKKKDFQFIMENCDSLREIGFVLCKLKKSMIECIKERGHKIEAIFFYFTSSKIDFYSDFLKFCPNLKKLHYNNFPMKTDWMCHEYPKLRHLTFGRAYSDGEQISSEHLKIFLQRNAHIKSFGICPSILWEYIDIFINSKLKLDVLILASFHSSYNTLLNRLYDNGFYKRLECKTMRPNVTDQMGTLHGFEKLNILTLCSMVDIPTAVSLIKELCISDHPGNADIYPSMAVSFPNVRKVRLSTVETMDQILPFIAHSPKLKELSIRRMSEVIGFEIDLLTLHEERSKLAGTCKVIIYLPEDFYFATKQAPKNLYINHELIEIKRTYELEHGHFDGLIWC